MAQLEEVVKRRIVGAGVIILALVLLVVFLVRERQARIEILTPIPPQPEMDQLEIQSPKKLHIRVEDMLSEDLAPGNDVKEPEKTETIDLEQAIAGQPVPEPVETLPKTDLEPEKDSEGRLIAWTLKVGSFSNVKNANALKDRLRKQGLKAYVKPSPDSQYHRVFVGPEYRKEDLQKIKAEVDRKYKLSSVILKFRTIAK